MTWLFFWLVDEAPDMTNPVAVEFAYQLLHKNEDPVVPVDKDPDPNCPECRGTGKIKTGDGISWTRCDCTLRTSQSNAPVKLVPVESPDTQRR